MLGRGAEVDDRIRAAAHRFGIEGALDTQVGGYSTGMKTRLALTRSVLHEPDLRLLVVDMARLARTDPKVAERHTRMFDDEWHQVGSRLVKIFPDGEPPVPVLQLGALVMDIAYGNATQLHAGLTAGDLIRLALRALRDPYGR